MVYIGYDDVWKKIYINGIYTNYSISNMGNVRNDKTNKLIKPYKVHDKYYMVPLSLIDENGNKYKKCKVLSRLVAEAFIPIPQKYIDDGYTIDTLDVDHIRDWDPLNHEDNTVFNLQWLTHQENVKKAQQHGLYAKDYVKGTKQPSWGSPGESNPLSKYTDEQARRVCERLVQNKLDMWEIVKDTNTSIDFVYKIKSGTGWRHISKDYNFSHYDRIHNLQYEPKVLKELDILINSGESNKKIREILNLENNKTTTALISKHRAKCGKPLEKRRKLSKEYLTRLDQLILDDKNNEEIRIIMGMENNHTTDSLLASHRMKLKKPVKR